MGGASSKLVYPSLAGRGGMSLEGSVWQLILPQLVLSLAEPLVQSQRETHQGAGGQWFIHLDTRERKDGKLTISEVSGDPR